MFPYKLSSLVRYATVGQAISDPGKALQANGKATPSGTESGGIRTMSLAGGMTSGELLLLESHFAQMVRQTADSKSRRARWLASFDSLGLCNIRGVADSSQMAFCEILRVTANEHNALPCRRSGESIGGVRHGDRGSIGRASGSLPYRGCEKRQGWRLAR